MSSFTSHTVGRDIRPGPYTVTFAPGQQYAYLTVSPVDDDTAELIEYFTLMIISVDRPEVVAIGSPSTSVIAIADNDGALHLLCYCCVCVCIYVYAHMCMCALRVWSCTYIVSWVRSMVHVVSLYVCVCVCSVV